MADTYKIFVILPFALSSDPITGLEDLSVTVVRCFFKPPEPNICVKVNLGFEHSNC